VADMANEQPLGKRVPAGKLRYPSMRIPTLCTSNSQDTFRQRMLGSLARLNVSARRTYAPNRLTCLRQFPASYDAPSSRPICVCHPSHVSLHSPDSSIRPRGMPTVENSRIPESDHRSHQAQAVSCQTARAALGSHHSLL
jgi:hypothetical protein